MAKELENKSKNIHVVILCGGGGKRLWPVSTKKLPKQFVSLLGSGKTLFEETVERAKLITKPENIWIITAKGYEDLIFKQFPEASKDQVIVEPVAKNTAMAHVVSSFFVYNKDPHAIIVNLASDHHIPDNAEFLNQMDKVLEFLKSNKEYILTVGIKPTHPDVNYGYIKKGNPINESQEFFKVEEFKEKPDLITAKQYLKSGEYFWNACLYTWPAQTFIDTVQRIAPNFWELGNKIYNALGTDQIESILVECYEKAENISIDYAISEKANNLALYRADFFWSDVGNWEAIYRLSDKDKQGNFVFGNKNMILSIESNNNLIRSDKKLVVAFGVEDLIIIETEDSILVAPLKKAPLVGAIPEQLSQKQN